MTKRKVLIQVDSDAHPSTFDSIVAIDSGIDFLLTQHSVSPFEIQEIVHGAMFTRGGDDLKHTALFFGGSDVEQTQSLVRAAKRTFFGPLRVSMMDPNGSNTTAAAAVLSVEKHLDLKDKLVTVLAATGPVGIRIAQLASKLGATVRVCSRRESRAQQICDLIVRTRGGELVERLIPCQTASMAQTLTAIQDSDALFSAGAAGVEMLDEQWLNMADGPSVAVDLNAVPPTGIHSIEVTDKVVERGKAICYGAIGVGGLKMKLHRRCLQKLFEANDHVLEIDSIYEFGRDEFFDRG